jgi:tetratricopeptide (TPR) repeat protein
LYALTGKLEKGFRAGTVADSLQPGLHNTIANLGVLNERRGNHLFAEEYYRKAIDINARHFYPFERLGQLYNHTAQFALADSFYYEAEIRKKGYYFDQSDWSLVFPPIPPAGRLILFCPVDTAKLLPDDMMALFTWGVQEYNANKYSNAVRILKRVVALDKKNPLVYHYLGKIYYDQQQWEAAGLMFGYAMKHYLLTEEFERHADSVTRSKKYPYDHSCFENFFIKSHYEQLADYCFSGKLNENRGHYAAAETAFRTLMELSPFYEGGYLRTVMLLEKLGRYTEAEEVIKSYNYHKEETSGQKKGYLKNRTDMELNAFYRRMTERFPQEASWPYKLGLLLYAHSNKPSATRYLDTILYFPFRGRELFVDADLYYQLGTTPETSFADKNVTGTPEAINTSSIPYKGGTIKLPGTFEEINLADGINTPRKDGITFLLRAAELMGDSATLADIYFKTGDMYLWAGSKKQALPFFRKSLEWASGNADTRLQVAGLGRRLFQNRLALQQMEYLYEQRQISFPMRLSLAECYMLAGQFEPARKALNEAIQMHPYPLPVTDELEGRLAVLSGNKQQAIDIFRKIWEKNSKDSIALYHIARLNAQMGNKKEAWKWLGLAIQNGFCYAYVLKYDPVFAVLRESPKWGQLLQPYRFVDYKRVTE